MAACPSSGNQRLMSERRSRTRKPRRQGRRPATRESLPRVRILCEAAKTEPGYFSALARDFDLPNVSIRSPKRGQWGPAGITTTVRQESEQDSDLDEIWCVLDHDERDTEIEDFRSWLGQLSSREAGAAEVRAAISTPCFEYWLLLHFTFTDKPFQGTPGGPSACQQVIRALETYIEGYRKAGGGTYGRCREQLPTAIQNAKRSRRSGRSSSTDVWKLVERLQELRTLRRNRLPD